MTSKLRIAFATLGLLAAASLGCGDDGPTGPSASSLIGAWDATKAELVSLEDPSQKLDALAGGTLHLVIYDDHTWESVQTQPGQSDFLGNGTWSLSGRTLTLTGDDGDVIEYRVSCDGSTMTLTTNLTWDYDLDGTEEPARVTMVFVQ